jgi:hypothetical protein
MKRLIFIALLALTAPAQAALSDGFWVSQEIGASFEFVGMDFYVHPFEHDYYNYKCTIVDWPISSPTARATCETGQEYTLEIRMDGLKVNGHEMTQTFEAPD